MPGGAWRVRRAAWLIAVVLASPLACKPAAEKQPPQPPQPPQPKEEPRPASLPPFTGAQIEKVPFAAIRAYVEGLSFNPDTPWADVKPVDWAGDKIGGRDTSRIQPVVGAFHFDPAELAQGRIVARVSSTKVYPRTGFGRWWSYWWIDRNGVDRKTGKRGQWRSLFISDPRHTKAKKTWFERDFHVDSAYHDRCSGGSTCARLRPGTVTACYDCYGSWCATKPH